MTAFLALIVASVLMAGARILATQALMGWIF